MRALVVDNAARAMIRMADVARPVPAPNQVLVEVSHTSLNWGELNNAGLGARQGDVPGWDASGVVCQAAATGDGPGIGARVATFADAGGWAQYRAVDVAEVAAVPDRADLADAAALPVAGVTALRALGAAGGLLGRRVLVTGASGGVGRFAVQLASLGGAHVIAAVGSPERGVGLTDLGAREIVIGLDDITEPVDVVIENVGGPILVAAYERLAPGGSLQSIGWTSQEPAVFDVYATVGPAKSLTSFVMGSAVGRDLSKLLALLADGRLAVDIGWRGSWRRIEEATDALVGRRVRGKAVLDID